MKNVKTILAAALILTLAACSVKGSSAGDSPQLPVNPPHNQDDAGNVSNPQNPTPPAPAPAPQPPEKDPSETIGVVATSWDKVKYAFCSAQGAYGILIDFAGTDLSATKSGRFKLATRPCSGSKPFKWRQEMEFTSTAKQKSIVFDFGNSLSPSNCYGCGHDTIEVYGNLGPYNTGYGVMGGNSGPCVFLENKATGGDLFASQPMFKCQ